MKYLILIMLVCSSAWGMTTDEKIKYLEQRIEKLEAEKATSNGLKVKDMDGEKVKSKASRALSNYGSAAPALSKKQQEEIMNQIELFKKRSQENQKILDEIMNEDF
jgi:hypothetical protein